MSLFTCLRLTPRVLVPLAAGLLMASNLAAQAGSITGTVSDQASGQPIAAAQVFIANLELGVISQQNGTFSIQNVPAGTHNVVVQRLGFQQASQTVTVAAGEAVTVNFTIVQAALQLDQVIVTGTPGGTQRRAIGNTVQRMEVADITRTTAISNFQDLLGARTPGIRFSVAPGNIGVGSQITLRGIGSFNTARNQPLIYVDGVRVNNNAGAGPILGSGQEVNVLNDFNPDEIESIEIIKGPAAASLYGTEASGGVIQIITKRGAEGAPQFNFSVRQGTNFVTDPAGKLGTYWLCPLRPAPQEGAANNCTAETIQPYNIYDEATRYIREGYFDWPTPNLFSYGHAQAYTMDVAGGTSSIRYFLSANYTDDAGIVDYNTQEVLRLRGNLSMLFTDNFTADVSTGFILGDARYDQATQSDGAIWQDMGWSNGYYLDRITPFGTPGSNVRLGGFQEHLPSDVREQTFATRDWSRFTGSATLNHTIPNIGLGDFLGTARITQRLVAGLDKGWDTNINYFPIEPGVVPEQLTEFTNRWDPVYTETVDGQMRYSRPISTSYSVDYAVTASIVPNVTWTFDTSFGTQYSVNQSDIFTNTGQGFASPLSRTINQLAQSRINTAYSYIEDKSFGFYVQQQVGWNDRLFVTGAMRFDNNSTFGEEAPARRYPRLSGTWVLSEEGFWNIEAVNSFRVRAAWGQAGRQPSAVAGFNIYAATPGPGGAAAIRPTSPGNPGIEPEVSSELEYGFDYALFNDRISGEFTYYTRENKGALLGVPTLSSFGFPGSVDQNLGQIDNWGWELTVNNRVFESSALSFDLDLSADFTDNKIVDLGNFAGSAGIRAGLPWPYLVEFDWVVDAEFMEPGDTRTPTTRNHFRQNVYATCDSGRSLAPDPTDPAQVQQWGIVPGGEVVPCTDVTRGLNLFAGRAFAPYSFSVAPRITLLDGALQVFALAEGQYGRWRHDSIQNWGHNYNNSRVSILEDDPFWVASNRRNATRQSREKGLFKADFWRLRDVGMIYSLPSSWVQRTGASRASLSVSGQNLWLIWQTQKEIFGHSVVDPEYGNTSNLGGTGSFYASPALSSVSATIRVTF